MVSLIDMKDIDIAVIGESMAGKTTWITSMFNENVNCDLREICLNNSEGQTKIKTYYKLVDSSIKKLYLDSIEFERELLEQKINQESESIKVLFDFKIISNDILNDYEQNEKGIVYIDLHDKDLDIKNFFDKIINNKNIADSGVIKCVRICGPAHNKVFEIMKAKGIETVTIRDTRGLMDETDKFYEQRKKLNEKEEKNRGLERESDAKDSEILSYLLADRGILGADGCVFMTQGGNALNKAEKKKMYRFLFETILSNMPSFLVARSSLLNNFLDDKEFDINKYIEAMKVDEDFHFENKLKQEYCCQDYVKLLKDFGLFDENRGLKHQIMKNHYKQMLIPMINPEEEELRDWYIKNAHASLSVIIDELYKYKNELNLFMQKERELPEQLRERFLKTFFDQFKNTYFRRNDGRLDTRVLRKERVEDVAKECLKSKYYGGLVGERGGITTYMPGFGKTGKYAIDLLEAAYEQFGLLIEAVSGVETNAEEIKLRTYEYLMYIRQKYCFSYASTNTMFYTYFLYNAWCNLQKNNDICKYLDHDDDNKNALLIVKTILCDIINGIFVQTYRDGERISLL